jgi:hypothetical protein
VVGLGFDLNLGPCLDSRVDLGLGLGLRIGLKLGLELGIRTFNMTCIKY